MKKYLIVFGIIFTLGVQAQTAKDSLLTKMSKETCVELEKKDLSNLTMENVQNELGMVLMPVLMNNSESIEKVFGGSVTDMDAMQKLMMELSMKLSMTCPKMREVSMQLASGGKGPTPKAGKSPERIEEIKEGDAMKATLVAVTPGDITTLNIKDAKGKMIKSYWLEYFENSDILKANPKAYLNKKVMVEFVEKSVYDAARKTYKTIKVITSIDLL
jgi:hypothetical protein